MTEGFIKHSAPPREAFGADVLVVDDTPANLQVLSGMLKDEGYRVRLVPSGALALRAAASRHPDLILLDINMPEMDGYEVCRRLKEDGELAKIPVIFISALTEPLDKVRAFSTGGVDYVTKPFQIEEVAARVRTHLEIRRLQVEREQRARELETANDALRQAEELRDNLIHMLVHDMRAPLSGVLASLQFMEEDVGSQLKPESREDLRHAVAGGERLSRMISDLLDITRLEAGKLPLQRRSLRVGELFEQAQGSLGGLLKGRTLTASFHEELAFSGDPEILRRVLVNLFGNALKFTPPSATIEFSAEAHASEVWLRIKDDGPGIDPRYHPLIFEKFGQAQARAQHATASSGLGLTFCRLAVEAHGGKIGVDSVLGQGATFWIELPRSIES